MLWWKLNFSPVFNFLAVHEFTVEVIIPKIVNIVKNDMKESCIAHFLTTLKILTVVLNPFRVLPSFGFWHIYIFEFQLSFIEKNTVFHKFTGYGIIK